MEDWTHLLAIAAFLSLIFWMGVLVGRRETKTGADFTVGGRRVGTAFLSALLIATWASSYTILAAAEVSYVHGVSGTWWYAFGVALPIMFYRFPLRVGERIREVVPAGHTVVEFLGERFDTKTHLLALAVILTAAVVEVVAQIYGLALVLLQFAGIPLAMSVWIVGLTFVAYVSVGGEWSVAVTNFVLLMVICVSLVATIAAGLVVIGGPGELFDALPPTHRELLQWGGSNIVNFFLVLTALTLTEPVIWQQIFSARDNRVVNTSITAMALGWAPIAVCGGLLGLMGVARFGPGTLANPAIVAPMFVREALPAWAGVLFAVGLTAVVLSTAAAYLLSSVSIVVVDVWKRYLHPVSTDREQLRVARWATVAIGLVSILAATNARSMIDLLIVQSTFKMSLMFPLIFGLYAPRDRLTANGAFYGTLVGLVAAGAVYATRYTPWPQASYDLVASVSALVLSVVCSLAISRFQGRSGLGAGERILSAPFE